MGGRGSGRRQLVAGVVVLVIAGIAVAGWIIGSRTRSPEQAAARAVPPEASLITAPVELRVLSSNVVTRGNVVPGRSATVTGPVSEDGAVVTGVFVGVGDELSEGQRVVEVSGRPVLLLEGEVPAFRAMRPGMLGADVAQLQAALARLNCDTADDDGVYAEATKRCVGRLYEVHGYDTVPTSDTEAADLAEAEDAVAEAEKALGEAQAALDDVRAAATESELLDAEVAVDAARRKVGDESAAGADSRAEAAAAVDAAILALNAELANRESTPADRVKALAELDAAAIKAAAIEREIAEASATAAEALRSAEAKVAELIEPPDVESETAAVEQARAVLERAQTKLDELGERSGPTVPLGEVVFVDALPATVNTLNARLGATVAESQQQDVGFFFGEPPASGLAVLATAGLQVEAFVRPSDADLVQVGMDVELRDEISGDTVAGTLVSLGEQVETSASGNDRGFPAVAEGDEPLPRQWTGRNVRVTFTAAATEREVLVVPVAALSSGSDGDARVEVLGDGGSVTTVAVEPGLSAEGFVEVTPVDGAELHAGDLVVVGSNA